MSVSLQSVFLDFIASLTCDSTPYDMVNGYQPACVIDEGSTAWFHAFTDVLIFGNKVGATWTDATGCKYVVSRCHDFMIYFDHSTM